MAYILDGRALGSRTGPGAVASCIFCGRLRQHPDTPNASKPGEIVRATFQGEVRAFLRCKDLCPQAQADDRFEHSVWFCDCTERGTHTLDDPCPECHFARGYGQRVVYSYTLALVCRQPLDSEKRGKLVTELGELLGTRAHVEFLKLGTLVSATQYALENWFNKRYKKVG